MEFTGERFVPEINGDIKYEHLHRYALALDFAEGMSVLDIASGEGYGSAILAKSAHHVTGVDIDPESVSHAQAQYGHFPNLDFLVGSCSAIPIADASIDVVTSFETIEHHDQHEEMMQEINRVLNVEGLLIISSPNRLIYSDESNRVNPFHVKELYYEEFLDLLKRHFRQIHIYGQKLETISCVMSLEPSSRQEVKSFSGDANALVNSAGHLLSPRYFVAICSNRKTPLTATLESTYFDTSDELLTQLQNAWYSDQAALQQVRVEKAGLQQVITQHQAELHSTRQELAEANLRLRKTGDLQEECEHLKMQVGAANQQLEAIRSGNFRKIREMWLSFRRDFLRK
jgi:ubiquinone/menaquinone biosynthesis C-methylase UbiE